MRGAAVTLRIMAIWQRFSCSLRYTEERVLRACIHGSATRAHELHPGFFVPCLAQNPAAR